MDECIGCRSVGLNKEAHGPTKGENIKPRPWEVLAVLVADIEVKQDMVRILAMGEEG